MAPPHLPDIDKLAGLLDDEVAFFAAIGALLVLTSRLDALLFDAFRRGTGFNHTEAKKVFTPWLVAGNKRTYASVAMEHRLRDDARLADWIALKGRIELAQNGLRNTVAHGNVKMEWAIVPAELLSADEPVHAPGFGIAFGSVGAAVDVFSVPSNKGDVDFQSLLSNCRLLKELIGDLEFFLEAL